MSSETRTVTYKLPAVDVTLPNARPAVLLADGRLAALQKQAEDLAAELQRAEAEASAAETAFTNAAMEDDRKAIVAAQQRTNEAQIALARYRGRLRQLPAIIAAAAREREEVLQAQTPAFLAEVHAVHEALDASHVAVGAALNEITGRLALLHDAREAGSTLPRAQRITVRFLNSGRWRDVPYNVGETAGFTVPEVKVLIVNGMVEFAEAWRRALAVGPGEWRGAIVEANPTEVAA